jgi:flavin-dependent dehydrogenase
MGKDSQYDVVVMGGGLAGLGLALQLRKARPETSVLVIEKGKRPAREAAFKVGESNAEITAHYMKEILGMEDHLEEVQYHKTGPRFMFSEDGNRDIARRVELWTATHGGHPTYQIDRGAFENALWERNRAHGTELLHEAAVEDVELADGEHTVTFKRDGESHRVTARWVVDAAGRAAILRRKLDLHEDVGHKVNSAWLRLDGGLDLEDFSDDPDWLARYPERGFRRRATNHLTGAGYWVWLIQLGTGPISIGICADPELHPFDEMNDLDRALDWLDRHEPQLAAALRARREDILDFLKVEGFAHSAKRVFSPDRWALTGDAGPFSDPLFSPGGDFIALSNMAIADLILRELAGEDIRERADFLDDVFLRLFRLMLGHYEGNYPLLGNAQVWSAKVLLDVSATHLGLLALVGVKEKLTDLDFMTAVMPAIERFERIAQQLQPLWREWAEHDTGPWQDAAIMFPDANPFLDVLAQDISDEELRGRVSGHADLYEVFAAIAFLKGAELALGAEIDDGAHIDPYKVTLDRDRWEADGVLGSEGVPVAQARALADAIFGPAWLPH